MERKDQIQNEKRKAQNPDEESRSIPAKKMKEDQAERSCLSLKKLSITATTEARTMRVAGQPLVTYLLSADERRLELDIPVDELKFICSEAVRRGKPLRSVGKLECSVIGNRNCARKGCDHFSSCLSKQDFDDLFQVLPELETSSFVLPILDESGVSGIVTSFLDSYRGGAENTRRLQVVLQDDFDPDEDFI